MNQKIRLPKSATLTTSILLSAAVFYTPAFAVSPNQFQSNQFSVNSTLSQTENNYLLAQATDTSCRQVIARSGLYVRTEPTVNSTALGIIQSGRNVTIANTGGNNGWVPITAPMEGYVYGGFLGLCDTATAPPPSNCRRVVATGGAPVRQQPTLEASRLGAIRYGRRVTIDNFGANGWVPITVPIRGYIQSDYLGYCRG
jgi:uncharacterized protein YgiM (DUF1202 family)